MSEADDFIELACKTGAFTFDVEHAKSGDMYQPGFELWGVGFCTGNIANPMTIYVEDPAEYSKICRALFPKDLYAIAYNGKYDMKCLAQVGAIEKHGYPKHFIDPMVMVNLLDENRKPNEMGLKVVVYDQYGHRMMNYEEAESFGRHSEEFKNYGKEDAYWEYRLFLDLKPRIEGENLWKLLTTIYSPMTKLAADIELEGIGWDIPGARDLLRGFQVLRKQLQESIFGEIGEINLGSGDQIAKRLFEDMGYSTRGLEMTKSGSRVSTDAKAMEHLARKYPICEKIVRWRTCSKMIGTYIEPLTRKAMADPQGRVHPTIWLVSTNGRTRFEDPNCQNFPAWLDKMFKHLNIRKNIVPKPGWVMLVCDLSQIELRLCGHISQDPEFLRAYREWNCTACGATGSEISQILHVCPKCNAAEDDAILKDPKIPGFWHGLDLHQMTTDGVSALGGDRQAGKMANFALIYYATAPRLHYEYPKFSIKQWDDVIYDYFQKYSGVKRWHRQMEQTLNMTGVTQCIFGRKRRMSRAEITKSPKRALNQFINMPVQASACHYMELCMTRLREHWIETGHWRKDIIQSNFVHDEASWECPEDMVDEFLPTIQHYLENTVKFQVPIRTSSAVVRAWGDAK